MTRKEILIHEAHRHPYLETLAYLYMMQLRHRSGFAKRACSAWRLVFVLALMPWLHKYRDLTRPEHFGEEEEEEFLNRDDASVIISTNPRASVMFANPRASMIENKSSLLRSSCMLRKSMVSSRWMPEVLEIAAAGEVDTDSDSKDIDNRNIESGSRDLQRIIEIKQEIQRLHDEMSALETKVGVSIKMPGHTTN